MLHLLATFVAPCMQHVVIVCPGLYLTWNDNQQLLGEVISKIKIYPVEIKECPTRLKVEAE